MIWFWRLSCSMDNQKLEAEFTEKLAIATDPWERLQLLEQLRLALWRQDKPYRWIAEEAAKQTLLKLKKEAGSLDFKYVRIVSFPECCDRCAENTGKVLTWDDAMKHMP